MENMGKKANEENPDVFKIRPAARHILTIGRDLIKDRYAAIVELVKNSYDADSPSVNIVFEGSEDRSRYRIVVEDAGHGMTRDTVINKWMVPSTDDKLKRRISPGGRTMQGRKGVGRYAASILGNDLLLETTTDGVKTSIFMEWASFEEDRFLDDVEVLVESEETDLPSGTRLTMTGGKELLAEWDQKQLNNLKYELKKLQSPVKNIFLDDNSEENFQIHLRLTNFLDDQDYVIDEEIEPYPIFDLYDYKISGKIDSEGTGVLTYSFQKIRNAQDEIIPFELGAPTDCGELFIDIRVYDRDKDAIELLIKRGLKDESGKYVQKMQAKRLLDQANGIGVYRNNFRIRPLGDHDFDWLKLNEKRIQEPTQRIGNNQVIGYVLIQSEEQSGLIEKSARDGLHENHAFEQLKKVTGAVIKKLETRRYDFRKKAGLSRPTLRIEQEMEKLFSFDDLKRGISTQLKRTGIKKDIRERILKIISNDEAGKNRIADDLRKTVAVYQGQATLGKIIDVILHEGRRPLNYFKNQVPNLTYWNDIFRKDKDLEILEKILPIADGIGMNADIFVELFARLDPLATGKRGKKKPFRLTQTIKSTVDVLKEELKKSEISVKLDGPEDFEFTGWYQDFYAIFVNLVHNSVYWLNEKKIPKKKITVSIETENDKLQFIDYRDNGPGIEPELISSEVIFEPQFSTKPDGTGIGLAIAGEAASRNDLELKAFESDLGAYFRLQPILEEG